MGKAKQAKRAAKAEHRLVGAAAKARKREPIALLGAASEIADQPPLVALSLATIAAGLVLRRRDVARTGARMLIAHALATGGKTLLKRSIHRSRPARALQDGKAHVGAGKGSGDSDFNSFPSGHTAGAVSVAQAIAHTAPQFAGSARAGAAAIAAMQLPRGAHYPSDIAVGAALGWIGDKAAGILLDSGERTIERLFDRHEEQAAQDEAEAHPS